MKYLSLEGNLTKKMYNDMSIILGEKRPFYSIVKTGS
jgi:hypothetical protein